MKTDPVRREQFRRFVRLTTRWSDNDVYGHLNNVVHYALFDTAVNQAMIGAGLLDPLTSAAIGLVVESGCRYHAPLAFPDEIEAGLRVAHLGRSSVRYEIGLFRAGDDVAAADGHFIHVYVDRIARTPASIPPDIRSYLEILRSTEPAANPAAPSKEPS